MFPNLPPETPPTSAAGNPTWDFAGAVQAGAPLAGRAPPRVPDAIEHRYLRVADRYFFPDRTLAFIDEGGRILVRTENREVLHSVVAIVEARGWTMIDLSGTEAFRQGMWREAALRGIDARGYTPTPPEVLQVQRVLKRPPSSHATGPDPRPASPPGAAAPAHDEADPGPHAGVQPSEAPQVRRSLREGPRPPVQGTLVAAAAAPYQFDPTQRMSYYVTLRAELGERTIWGTDLERALAESKSRPRVGDAVVLMQHGTRPVSIRLPARNAEGEWVGQKTITAQRARWSAETAAYLQELQRKAMLVRSGELLSSATLMQSPDLAAAAAGLKLAQQYVRRVTSGAVSRSRLLQVIRDRMAEALEQGQTLRIPQRRPQTTPTPVRHRAGPTPEERDHARI